MLLILLENGLLAVVLLLAAFFLNLVLQRSKLRGEAANEIAGDRAKAYIALWKSLASVRPLDKEPVTPEKAAEIEKVLVDWYHEQANALYMSWGTAHRYMKLRQALAQDAINSKLVRARVSALRTQLKVDCGVYSSWDAIRRLPKPKKKKKKKVVVSKRVSNDTEGSVP
ncbi:MAG: hypothetical protein V2I66_01715 [Halieaceae bacterium]|nr:hypothetical protein [Halieaceae bacterium]